MAAGLIFFVSTAAILWGVIFIFLKIYEVRKERQQQTARFDVLKGGQYSKRLAVSRDDQLKISLGGSVLTLKCINTSWYELQVAEGVEPAIEMKDHRIVEI